MVLYKIPVIQPDLRHEEAIHQSLNALDYLNDVINEVFDKINARLAKNNEKIQNIGRRIETANRKIEILKDSKKAISFYCPAKYPGHFEDFENIFTETQLELKRSVDIRSPLRPTRDGKPSEKLQFFHVAITEAEPKVKPKRLMGIPIPLDMITSIDSLLVFKDDEKHGKSKTPSSSAFVDGSRKLEAAPVSIMKGQNRPPVDDMFYTPTMDEAPELEFPMDIPDLPGVAGDISFMDGDFLAIPEPRKPPTVVVEPEPKPIPVDSTPIPAPRVTIQEPSQVTASIPPPPPPPMADLNASPAPKKELPDASAARSNLMAAIRGAGGKLKSRAAADRVPEPPKKKEKSEPAGDLMSDLRNRLSMRRKGISGAKNQVESDSLMGKISSMIPPPPMEKQTEEQSDEDWN